MVVGVDWVQSAPVGNTAVINHAEFVATVGYRPVGGISDARLDGRKRLNGWFKERLHETADDPYLDGHGQPLPPGAEPVFVRSKVYRHAEYNDFKFGTFEGEFDGPT